MNLVVVVHNIRSSHNVGSILRTADGFGVSRVYFTGYSPYPTQPNDTRLPHVRLRVTKDLHKVALGAELHVPNQHHHNVYQLLSDLKEGGYQLVALEQTANSVKLDQFTPDGPVALLLGEEVHGITKDLLKLCDAAIEIPMNGHKESFNVSVATGIALYQLSLKL
jgi:23S rRNA (guanosine2251-2'-O)-methyltransferase